MSGLALTGAAMVAGVVGDPVAQSLSPRIHGAWIAAAGLDAAYVPLRVGTEAFRPLMQSLRGGVLRGVNVTVPHKQDALAIADETDLPARRSGAANVLIFHADGRIEARNTDAPGLLYAFSTQAPRLDLTAAPVVVIGAGGAARGACAALVSAGVSDIRLVNRTWTRAAALAETFPHTTAYELADVAKALEGAGAVINATTGGMNGANDLDLPLDILTPDAVVMDMVYKPLRTGLARAAKARGLTVVDGLAMLVGQAIPSFEAFYGRPPPTGVDVRALCLAAIGETD
jgi:shikimate dehydrogenase